MAVSSTGYSVGGAQPGPSSGPYDATQEKLGYWPLEKCRKAYTTYLDSKRLEIEEQQNARRYRHGSQWTHEQIKVFNDRKQPVVTYNRVGRKIDGIVGLVERLKQDPKAYPRSPRQQEGADLATAVLRYLMDVNRWDELGPIIAETAAVDGIAGIELDLKPRQQQDQQPQMPSPQQMPGNVVPGPGYGGQPPPPQQPDQDIVMRAVEVDGFFYDPRSFKHDFSDARFLGMGKWVDAELIKALLPQFADKLDGGADSNLDLTSNSDRDNKWFQDEGDFKQIRLVDIWYKHDRGWCWALFTGGNKLAEGRSPFKNEDGEEIAKYLMFSAAVDHDGDRYGFPRNLMSAQDEINQRRSKALHELNNRRVIATKTAVAELNVEGLRREAARADGIVLVNTNLDDIRFDDQAKQAAIMGQLEFLKEAKAEIENFGPNPAVLGDAGLGAKSGRAIQLLQQAGIAELGPYMTNMRSWKIRVYRALFNAAQTHWTNERWIRITDSQGTPQFVQINGMQVDPQTGMPGMVNPIGELDVDIVLDEGPDSITIMQDTYETISTALPAVAKLLSPQQVGAAMEALIETSPLPADVKKKFRDAGQAPPVPPPEVQTAQAKLQIEQQMGQQKLQLDGARMQQEGQLKQASSAADMQIEQQKLELEKQKIAVQIQAEREKAANQMQIERDKADHQVQLELFKAQNQAEMARQKTTSDNEMEMHRMNFKNEQEQKIRKESGNTKSPDDMLATMMDVIGQSHQHLIGALTKPRKAVIHRDPKTGKVIGAVSVTEG